MCVFVVCVVGMCARCVCASVWVFVRVICVFVSVFLGFVCVMVMGDVCVCVLCCVVCVYVCVLLVCAGFVCVRFGVCGMVSVWVVC